MKSYPDKGIRFSRNQLIFVADVMITSAMDAIDCSLPKVSGASPQEFNQHFGGILSKLSWDLSIFYSQLTNDGIGCCDVIDMLVLDEFLNECCTNKKKRHSKTLSTELATKYVDKLFKDYLKPWTTF